MVGLVGSLRFGLRLGILLWIARKVLNVPTLMR